MLKKIIVYLVLICFCFCSCSKLKTNSTVVLNKNNSIKNKKIYTELGKIYNGTNILDFFNKYDDLGCIIIHEGNLDNSMSFFRSTSINKIEKIINDYPEYFNNELKYEIYSIIEDDIDISSKESVPYIINFENVTNCINELLISDNGQLKVSIDNSNTYPVDKNVIDYINNYLKKQYLSYEEAYEFSNYLFDIKTNTKWKYKDRCIEPSFTVSMIGIESHKKMTKEQFNKLMLKDSFSDFKSIKVFNNKNFNGSIKFLPSQIMPK